MLTYWAPGENNVQCQRCGRIVKSSQVTYDGYQKGLIVCDRCYDPFPKQEIKRVFPKNEEGTPKYVNPRVEPTYLLHALKWGRCGLLRWDSVYRQWGDTST